MLRWTSVHPKQKLHENPNFTNHFARKLSDEAKTNVWHETLLTIRNFGQLYSCHTKFAKFDVLLLSCEIRMNCSLGTFDNMFMTALGYIDNQNPAVSPFAGRNPTPGSRSRRRCLSCSNSNEVSIVSFVCDPLTEMLCVCKKVTLRWQERSSKNCCQVVIWSFQMGDACPRIRKCQNPNLCGVLLVSVNKRNGCCTRPRSQSTLNYGTKWRRQLEAQWVPPNLKLGLRPKLFFGFLEKFERRSVQKYQLENPTQAQLSNSSQALRSGYLIVWTPLKHVCRTVPFSVKHLLSTLCRVFAHFWRHQIVRYT